MAPLMLRARREGIQKRVFSKCIPGGTIPQVTRELKASILTTGCSSLNVNAHVGTNDASRRGSEKIISSFKNLISEVSRVREDSGADLRLSISSIVPRTDCGTMVWCRVVGLNGRLRYLCKSQGVYYVDLMPALDSCRVSLNTSGVHYTPEAAKKVILRAFRGKGMSIIDVAQLGEVSAALPPTFIITCTIAESLKKINLLQSSMTSS